MERASMKGVCTKGLAIPLNKRYGILRDFGLSNDCA